MDGCAVASWLWSLTVCCLCPTHSSLRSSASLLLPSRREWCETERRTLAVGSRSSSSRASSCRRTSYTKCGRCRRHWSWTSTLFASRTLAQSSAGALPSAPAASVPFARLILEAPCLCLCGCLSHVSSDSRRHGGEDVNMTAWAQRMLEQHQHAAGVPAAAATAAISACVLFAGLCVGVGVGVSGCAPGDAVLSEVWFRQTSTGLVEVERSAASEGVARLFRKVRSQVRPTCLVWRRRVPVWAADILCACWWLLVGARGQQLRVR